MQGIYFYCCNFQHRQVVFQVCFCVMNDLSIILVVTQKRHLLTITGNVFNLLVAINCSVNFILYSSFSSKFRATFRRLIGLSGDTTSTATSAAAPRATPVAMTTVHAGARSAGRGSSQWILYGVPVQQQLPSQQRRRMTCQIEYSEF